MSEHRNDWVDTVSIDDRPSVPAAPPPRREASAPRSLSIEFTGSGSEYFRIWIVNLLLTFITAGLYLPFAKARRISYFYANTLIDGQALTFHGDPWKMFRGFLLLGLLMGAYAFAGQASPFGALVALCVMVAVWPALWRSSMQFRLGNTSWRGLRFRFDGELADAYKVFVPVYIPVLIMAVVQAAYAKDLLALQQGENAAMPSGLMGLLFTPLLLMYAAMPWSLALIKRYQHGGYVYAGERTRLDVPTLRFYGLALKSFLMTLAVGTLLGLIGFGFVALMAVLKPSPIAITIGVIVLYIGFFALLAPYFIARMQNLVWNGTASPQLRFGSRLSMRSLSWLTFRNWPLTALTLGLYRPFAAVNTTKLRLAAMTIEAAGDIDTWSSHYIDQQDATGEAAGDFFGIDMGL